MNKLRIFLADDHEVVREGLKRLVIAQPDMEVIGEAAHGRQAVERALQSDADVVIMDLSMPELSGAEATALLKQERPAIKVVALSVHEDVSYLRRLLEAGASGYVLKRSAAETLIQAVRIVAAGSVYLDPLLTGTVIESFVDQHLTTGGVAVSTLSERETDVVQLIAQGYSNKEIAAQLGLSVKTVETYKARAMEKLGFTSRVALVRYAAQQGWLA
ncbi:response regulator transcription factor [Chloroflexia bacterium SDU3-3]|nr:response regulator transcription factor [Chloroflexia bacterium SDU3-3]